MRLRHGRLFWRVYSHGVLLLVLVAVAVGLSALALRSTAPWHGYPERLAGYLSDRAGGADLDEPEVLAGVLDRERKMLGAELSVYRLDGSLIATNVQPPVSPLRPEHLHRLSHGTVKLPRLRMMAVPVYRGGTLVAYVSIGGMPALAVVTRLAVGLGAVLLALLLGSFPLARAITSPLEKLTRAVQRFGSGDLGARAGIERRDEVGALARAFDEMAERLEKLVRGEKELIANVSHELRTPMARIRVALELAAEGDGARLQGYLKEISSDLAELDGLVEEVLTLARLDLMGGSGGAPPLKRERVPAASFLEQAAQRFRSAHPDRPLYVRLEQPLPEVDVDASLIRRVVDNLLDNARKYSDAGTPVVLAASGKDGLTVEVIDQGIGIEEKDLASLFRPFFRTERSRSRGTGGVGLGLALARKIVEAHGGRIGAESAVGKGSTLRFTLPAAGSSA